MNFAVLSDFTRHSKNLLLVTRHSKNSSFEKIVIHERSFNQKHKKPGAGM